MTEKAKKSKEKTGEKKFTYVLQDYLALCKVQTTILDFKGIRQEYCSLLDLASSSVATAEEMTEVMEKVPGNFKNMNKREPLWLELDRLVGDLYVSNGIL